MKLLNDFLISKKLVPPPNLLVEIDEQGGTREWASMLYGRTVPFCIFVFL